MALMDMRTRSAAVQALEETSVVKIGAKDMLGLYQQDIEQFTLLQMNLGREVSRRLRDADDFIFHTRIGAEAESPAPSFPKFYVPIS
jgi:CRP-like cAMP-binding protein